MTQIHSLLLLGLFAALTSSVRAACDPETLRAVQGAVVGEKEFSGRFSSCEALPNDRSTVASVFAFERSVGEGEYVYDVHLALLDAPFKTIVARREERGIWPSDAYKIKDVAISSANFSVTNRPKAFGVVESWGGSSGVAFYEIKILSVYQQRGQNLVPVLSGLVISVFQGEGCDVQIIRDLDFSSSSGRAALGNITVTEHKDGLPRGQQSCAPVPRSNTKYVLKAVNGVYHVPKQLQPFGDAR